MKKRFSPWREKIVFFTFTYLTLSNGDLVKHSPVYSERPPQSLEQGMLTTLRPSSTRRSGGPMWSQAGSSLRHAGPLQCCASQPPPRRHGQAPVAAHQALRAGLALPPEACRGRPCRPLAPCDPPTSRRPGLAQTGFPGGAVARRAAAMMMAWLAWSSCRSAGLVVVPKCHRAAQACVCVAVAASPRLPHAAW